MTTRIFLNGMYRNLKPTDSVKTTRAVHSFACENCLRDSLLRSQGGWYKLGMDGILVFACRTLSEISFNDLYTILKD